MRLTYPGVSHIPPAKVTRSASPSCPLRRNRGVAFGAGAFIVEQSRVTHRPRTMDNARIWVLRRERPPPTSSPYSLKPARLLSEGRRLCGIIGFRRGVVGPLTCTFVFPKLYTFRIVDL